MQCNDLAHDGVCLAGFINYVLPIKMCVLCLPGADVKGKAAMSAANY